MNLDSSNRVPVLRFKNDEGEEYPDWQETKLGEITTSFSGGTPKSTNRDYYSGDIPFIKSGEISSSYTEFSITEQALNNSSAKKVNAGDILYALYGATSGEVAIAKIDGAINQAVLCIRSQNNHRFLFYNLGRKKTKIISTFLQGGQGNLSAEIIKSVPIKLPSSNEQKKIANFLSAIDKRIEQLEMKKSLFEQYKKGMMQKIFRQEIRFKDDQGKEYPEWEEISLKQILKYEQPTGYIVSNTDYSNEYETPVLTAGKTFVLGYTDDTEGLFLNHLPVILFDDFTTAIKFVDFPFKVKSSAIKILLPRLEDVSMTFVYEAMKRIRFPLGEHKRYWISEYQNEKISYPNREERQKIANFLSAVDRKNKLISVQIEITREFKKGLLQQMFV